MILSTEISESPLGDARLTVSSTDGNPVSRADLWWKETPLLGGHRIGAIGAFQAADARSARHLLDAATAHLGSLGLHTAVGPMDGNTWHSHRFVVESDGRPPFFMEPQNPASYPDWWRDAGFSELSRYSSSRIPLDGPPILPNTLKRRILRSGISLENLDPDHFDNDLRAIHALSLKSFSNNFLYTPLPENGFLASYAKIRDHVDPSLVKLARRGGQLVGFVFGIPDRLAPPRGEIPAIIVKTLAVDPTSRAAGLGSLLVDEIHLAAAANGHTEAIHALQHESNTSLKITGRNHGSPFRRYALFSKKL